MTEKGDGEAVIVEKGRKTSVGITRRVFTIGSVAIAGGVAFGTYHYHRPIKNPLMDREGEITLNPYLFITVRGVKIIAPRAEMGQGIHTTLAAMVAEELDVDWESIEVVHGPPSAAYYNEEILKLALPFPHYVQSTAKSFMTVGSHVASKFLSQQITGGSTSVRDGFLKMRQAGASARLALIEAAAYELDVPSNELKTGNGTVSAPDGRTLTYQELATSASAIEPVQNPTLKETKSWRYLGRSMSRKDMVGKVTGTAEFGIDVMLDNMLFATVRMNPYLGGNMVSFDATKATAMPGVVKVVDLGNGIGVIAKNTWIAFKAAEAVHITWGDPPYSQTTEALYADIERAFEEAPNSTLRDEGSVDDAFASVEKSTEEVITADYRVPYLAHTTMEPLNATARLDQNKLDIWTGNQVPLLIKEQAAKEAGIAVENVSVHTPYLGGGFGRRAETDYALQAVMLAKAMPKHAVKMTWSREEDVTHDFYRPAALAKARAIMRQDGPRALKLDIAAPSVLRDQSRRALGVAMPGADKLLVEGAFDQPYGFTDCQVNGYIADVGVPVGSWRSVGHSYNAFFLESFLDELAVAKKLDPIAMRLNLMRGIDQRSFDTLRQVGDMAGWGAPTGAGLGRSLRTGRGVAFCYSFGSPVGQIVDVSESGKGISIDKVWCAIDVGTALDPAIIEAQLISGILYGLSAAIYGEITFKNGAVVERNFDSYDALRMANAPPIEVKILQSSGYMGGVGEVGTPPSIPALTNAVYQLTGKRVRQLPLGKQLDFATFL